MIKKLKVSEKESTISVKIEITYSEFQDLRSFMNIISQSKDWEIYNTVFGNVPSLFNQLLHEG